MATNPWAAEVARVQANISQTRANIARDRALLAQDPTNSRLQQQIASGENYLIDLQTELATFTTEYNNYGATPVDSAGAIVTQSQLARDDSAGTQNPSAPTTATGRIQTFTTDQVNQNLETGTTAPTKTIGQTQATPADNFGVIDTNSQDTVPKNAPTSPGVGAGTTNSSSTGRGEDTPPISSGDTQQILNTSFAGQNIVTQPNVLDQYASYTYAISWYLITPDQYNNMINTQKKNVSGWQLLMQSGGAPSKVASSTAPTNTPTAPTSTSGGRNPWFTLDYYLDDLEIESIVPLHGTNMANSATNIRFKVTEPNGLTLLDNLYSAVKNLYKSAPVSGDTNTTSTDPNYVMAQYVLVIRFYGYDSDGNLVAPAKGGYSNSGKLSNTDPQSVIEKFYPFIISNIKFREANRAIEYSVEGKPIPHYYNLASDRGTIPFAFSLSGETIGDILIGKPVGTVYPTADPGARVTTPTPVTPQTSPLVSTLPKNEQAAIAAGTDPNAVTDQGMAFGGGGLTGA